MWTIIFIIAAVIIAGLLALILYYYLPDIAPERLEREFADEHTRFVEVDGVRFHVRDEGEGPPLLLMHGLIDNLFSFDPLVAALKDRYRVLRIDLPAHGLTGPEPKKRYDWIKAAPLVLALIEKLGLERLTLVGHSMGGAVAWQIGTRNPEAVERLVLISPAGYKTGGGGSTSFILKILFRLSKTPAASFVVRLVPRERYRVASRGAFGDPSRCTDAFADRQLRLVRRKGNRDAILGMMGYGRSSDPNEELQRIKTPTLLIWGTKDIVLPVEQAEKFHERIDDSRLVRIEGAGHMVMYEEPEETARAIDTFIAESSRRTTRTAEKPVAHA